MSLKDLLPPGTYDEIEQEAGSNYTRPDLSESRGSTLTVPCPYCKKPTVYSTDNPFRPFCSERCKMLDLGAWASEERTVAGKNINVDEDADLLNDPNLPLRNIPGQN